MKTKYLLMLSEIIDKMEIKEELKTMEVNTGDEKADHEELGKQLIALIITRIYKCEEEFYSFVAAFKGYLPNKKDYEFDPDLYEAADGEEVIPAEKEKELRIKYKKDLKEALRKAEDEDIVSIFKEISKLDGVSSFLSLA